MTDFDGGPRQRTDAASLLLYAIAAVGLILGLYARFKGLGRASLEADEYFSVQSVGNILRSGVPAYACGGYYPRALAFQYVAACLQLLGLSGEVAVRMVAAICSVIALPGIFLLGKRIGGRAVGVAALAVLAVSLWEVEIARFGRMYAPFQAVVVWYLVYFLKFTVDGERRALWPLLVLTVLGALTWEGGVFLPLINLLIPFFRDPSGQLTRRDWLYLGLNLILLAVAYGLTTTSLRTSSHEPAFPTGYDPGGVQMPGDVVDTLSPLWNVVHGHLAWVLLAIVPLAVGVYGLRRVWMLRVRWPAALALIAALVFALAHQFAAVAAVLGIALLLGLVRWEEITARAARPYHATILALLVFWFVVGMMTSDWRGNLGVPWLGDRPILWLLYDLFRLPDLALQIGLPWMRAAPGLTLALALLIFIGICRTVVSSGHSLRAEQAAFLVLVCLAVGVGLSHPPRHETRYVFFLYPLAVILAISVVAQLSASVFRRLPFNALVPGALLALALFAFSEDFRPKHLLAIDSPAALMRLDLPSRLEGHVVPRSDVRGAAHWLERQAARTPHTLLINAYPSADYYFRDFDFTYIDRNSQRFRAFACRRGTVERWGNLPLVSTLPELEARIAGSGRAMMIASERDTTEFLSKLARWNPRIVWTAADGQVQILALGPAPG